MSGCATSKAGTEAENLVLEKFRGASKGEAHHFAEISRIQAALDLQRLGVLRCSWVPIGAQSSKDMLRCELAPGFRL